MLYAIFFVLLLAAAIFLKLKDKKNKEEGSTANKRPSTVAKRSTPKAKVRQPVDTTVTASPAQTAKVSNASTPVDEKTKTTIQQHLSSGNYSVAEAFINQCLNKDPSQHELYLELLAVHLAQKDDFSAKKLLEQLEQMGLSDVHDQAQIKYKATKYVENPHSTTTFNEDHSLDYIQSTIDTPEAPSTTAFDALNQTEWSSPTKTAEEPKDLSELEFTAAKVETPSEEPQALNFDFSTETASETVVSKTATDAASKEAPPLEFNLSATETPADTEQPAEALHFDFSQDAVSPSAEPAAVEAESIEAPVSDTHEALDFGLDSANAASTIATDTPAAQAVSDTLSQSEIDVNDPIVINFPHLRSVNEADLDLDLAEQYIQLGAYQAARELLEQSRSLNAAQQEKLAQLKQQLAS